MSNPYSSQSISGYNASPPADDGSQTTANQITWAKHKTKLADPIKTLSEGINSAVSTAFGKIFLNSASSKSTTYTVTADDQGKLINVTNTTTINLPASGSVGPNFVVTIRNNGSGTVTIDGNSSELINGSVTQTLAPSFSMILMSDGNGWYGVKSFSESVTSTVAEINELDASVAAISGYESGIRHYISNTSSELMFDVTGNLSNGVAETIGPTGSGADNIWTDMDSIPSTAKAVILGVYDQCTSAAVQAQFGGQTSAYKTGISATGREDFFLTKIQGYNHSGVSATPGQDQICHDAVVPIDGNLTFTFVFLNSGLSSRTIELYLRGFIV